MDDHADNRSEEGSLVSRFGGIEIRNLTNRDYGFPVGKVVAELLADVPAGDLLGLYQVALLDSRGARGTNDRTRWMGVYSNRDGRHALIELYLEVILGGRASRLDRLAGYLLSRIRLGQALFHQIGVHRERMAGRGWLFGPDLYSHYLMMRVFNPAKLLMYFPERILRRWRRELRTERSFGSHPTGTAGGRSRLGGSR